jgi:dephospho-CoA kinase
LSDREIEKIMASQASRAERLEAADDVLENMVDEAALSDRIEELHQLYLALGGQ